MKKRTLPWKEPVTGLYPIVIRFTKKQIQKINEKSYRAKMTRSKYLRGMILGWNDRDPKFKNIGPRFKNLEL